MRGLSLSQPYAWAMLHAGKGLENREWPPSDEVIGKRIALHAAKSFDDKGVFMLDRLGIIERPTEYQRSAIVGVGTVEYARTELAKVPEAERRWWIDRPNNYGWIISNRIALPAPIPWDGQLGLWLVPPVIEHEIERQLSGTLHYGGDRYRTAPYLVPLAKALQDHGITDDGAAWRAANPGVHLYFVFDGLPSCAWCGKIQPKATAKRPAKPCKGVVRIALRGDDDA